MSSILTNNSSMVALETLRNINRNLESVQNEISTGKSVASAKDNASIWAISTVMSTDVESFKQIGDSLNKGNATVGVARAASEQITGLLQDMKELIVDAQQDLNDSDRATIQKDVAAIRSTIGNIVNGAQMNGQNLLKGTDSLNVLASLDRDSAGDVKPAFISVDRVDLQTSAAIPQAAKEATDAGYVATEGSVTTNTVDLVDGEAGFLATSETGNITDGSNYDITVDGGSVTTGDKFNINVGGNDYEYTAAADDTATDVANGLKALIDDAGIADLTVTVTPGADPAADDATINLAAAGGDVTFDEGELSATTTESVLEDGNDIDVTIAGGSISTGDTFTVNVDETDYTYTAAEGDTNNDVAAGLKALLDAASVSDFEVTVADADDPASDAATLNFAANGGDVKVSVGALASTNAAVAAGGLGAIADLSVATSADATTALSTIDTLLDKAISAATTFGSGQKQIEGQTEFVQNLVDSMTTGIGSMVDADIEAASAKLQALQVQQQLGVQALSIANSAPQTLLSLFR
jgi:flagellin